MFLWAKPGSTLTSRSKLRISSPAPMSKTSANATSQITRPLRIRECPATEVRRPLSCKDALKPDWEARSAGASPNITLVSSVMTSVNPRTRPSSATSFKRGYLSGILATSASTLHAASNTPRIAPRSPSSALSVSICRTRRRRRAPSAARMASSFFRSALRARSRLATLAHAMSSTNPTAPNRMRSTDRASPTTTWCIGTSLAPSPSLISGYASSSRRATVSI